MVPLADRSMGTSSAGNLVGAASTRQSVLEPPEFCFTVTSLWQFLDSFRLLKGKMIAKYQLQPSWANITLIATQNWCLQFATGQHKQNISYHSHYHFEYWMLGNVSIVHSINTRFCSFVNTVYNLQGMIPYLSILHNRL